MVSTPPLIFSWSSLFPKLLDIVMTTPTTFRIILTLMFHSFFNYLVRYSTRHQLYGHLPPITKTIQARRTRHAGHCWRSRDEFKSDVLLWTPTYGLAKAGRPARTYIQQLCEDTGCSPEDLPEGMNNREKWRKRVRDIRACGTTWWCFTKTAKSRRYPILSLSFLLSFFLSLFLSFFLSLSLSIFLSLSLFLSFFLSLSLSFFLSFSLSFFFLCLSFSLSLSLSISLFLINKLTQILVFWWRFGDLSITENVKVFHGTPSLWLVLGCAYTI